MDRGYDSRGTFQQDLRRWIRRLYEQIGEFRERMKDGDENHLDKSTPIDFWKYAEAYARAGTVVKSDIGNKPYPEPAFYLFGQSIELSLKAFLLGQGIPIETLSSRAYGHDLQALLEKADEKRLDRQVHLYPKHRGAIILLSEPYLNRRLQYSRKELEKTYGLPDANLLEETAIKLVDILRRYCVNNSPTETES